MYVKNDLYKKYLEGIYETIYSSDFPDVTKKITLEKINIAINACDKWDLFIDIGSSNGHYAQPLLKKFRKGICVEINKYEELEKLKKENKNLEIIYNDFTKTDIKDKADFIMLIDVFEHIKNVDELLSCMSKIQDIGGVILILVPNTFYCGPAHESEIFYKKCPPGFGHIKHYTNIEIINFFKKYNYIAIANGYIEVEITQTIRRIVRGLSRRDLKYKNNIIYKFLRPMLLIISKPILKSFEMISYHYEKKANYENSRDGFFVFKKY